jgi:hypothetical protein
MTTQQIEDLFHQVLAKKAIYKKIEGVTEDKIYNWRKGRIVPNLGDMLFVLYQLKLIKVTHEPDRN